MHDLRLSLVAACIARGEFLRSLEECLVACTMLSPAKQSEGPHEENQSH